MAIQKKINLGLSLSRLHESESYFGDPKSKLPDFKHTISLVSPFHSATHFHSFRKQILVQVETCPKEDTYANIQRQALTIRLENCRLCIDPRPPHLLQVQSGEELDSLCHILLRPHRCLHLLRYSAQRSHLHTVSTLFQAGRSTLS